MKNEAYPRRAKKEGDRAAVTGRLLVLTNHAPLTTAVESGSSLPRAETDRPSPSFGKKGMIP
jgi:hypothetical protein